jgi:hypothetical protein
VRSKKVKRKSEEGDLFDLILAFYPFTFAISSNLLAGVYQ